MINGMPGIETPAAWKPGARRSAMYQMLGTLRPRCGSFDRRGFPLAVWAPEMTQLLEPGVQPWHARSLGFRERAGRPGFVVSHPCAKPPRKDGAPEFLGLVVSHPSSKRRA